MGDTNDDNKDTKTPETPETQTNDQPNPPPTQQAAPQAPPAKPNGKPEKKVISIPSDAMARIKQEEREKGRKLAEKELQSRAKAAGFESYEALIEAATSKKQDPPAAGDPPATQSPAPSASAVRKFEQERKEWSQERARLNKKANHEHKRRRRAERERDRLQALMVLREAAVQVGIKDVDYAMHLLKEAHAGKTAAELEGFDEVSYFAGLKETHPHLFGVSKAPASTAPTGGKPPEKKPEEKKPNGETKPKDARHMTRQEYEQHLRDKGITPPARLF